MKTAWFLMHRIREIMKPADDSSPLGGEGHTIEADVTFVGRRPFTKVKHGGQQHMNPVLSLVERKGQSPLRPHPRRSRTQSRRGAGKPRLAGKRWSRFPGQNGGLAKVDSGLDYAANFSSLACVA